jgi:hypothetical protein
MIETLKSEIGRKKKAAYLSASLMIGSTGLAGCSPQTSAEKPACVYTEKSHEIIITTEQAVRCLGALAIKERSPKTGYSREEFGGGWDSVDGCTTRETILERDLVNQVRDTKDCKVMSGILHDPYTGMTINFVRGESTSSRIQIDHVVPLSDAWQKGADTSHMDGATRKRFANDTLNLLAVDGPTNEKKGDGDAATWLPPVKAFRCDYVARQVIVKSRYNLWTTDAEHTRIGQLLDDCPGQVMHLPD